jgi:hypothetical protein
VYGSGGFVSVSPQLVSGILAISGQQGYRDGAADGAPASAWGGATTRHILIGAMSEGDNNLPVTTFCGAKIQAFALAATTLSAPAVAALSAAMAAL